jgi:hypothetical protein
LPDSSLLLTYNDGPDVDYHYGAPNPAFVSGDDGDETLLTTSHSECSQVLDGEYLCVPFSLAMELDDACIELPPPSGST